MQTLLHPYEGKSVVVTGASGYLGAALTEALLKTSARLLLVSRRPAHVGRVLVDHAGRGLPPSREATADRRSLGGGGLDPAAQPDVLTADVRERACWDQIVRRADVVFHLAGNTSVYAAASDPAESLRSTVLPLAHLLGAAQETRRVPRVVYASTVTVYGLTDRLPVGEDREPCPVTIHDLHKWFAEQQLEQASTQGVLDGVSLRLANVYGPSAGSSTADDRGVLTSIAKRALRGSDLPLYGDGRYRRDYVYIDDVVAAFLTAGIQPGMTGHAFNVATGRGVTVGDAFHLVAERAARVTGKRSQVRQVAPPEEADPIEFRNFVGDIRLISSACGWRPTVSLTEGVDRLINSLLKTGVDD